jgi:membrane dipeptidase
MTDHPRFDEALALHRRVPVVDGHADSILEVVAGKRTLAARSDQGHLDFPRAREGGLAATVQTAWPAPADYPIAAARVFAMVEAILAQIEASGGAARLVTTAAEIRACHRDGVLGVLLNVEGAEVLHGQIGVLPALYRLGVRMLQPVWNHRNAAADGVLSGGRGGLTDFGRELVGEMNRLGMVIDCSHLNEQGLADVLALSEQPVLFTHGNCRALFDHRRNLHDAQIEALAARGGVFGISVVVGFMAGPDWRECGLATMADHVEHAIAVGGANHVAYGSDYDGTAVVPIGLETVDRLPALTAELLARGRGEAELAAVLGGNYLRVFEAVFGR